MTNILHESAQETESANGITSPEPSLTAQNFIIVVSEISVDTGGYVTFKVQHSADGETWIDVPNLSTSGITSTGSITISVTPAIAVLDCQRVVWTFVNANTVTFAAFLTGHK